MGSRTRGTNTHKHTHTHTHTHMLSLSHTHRSLKLLQTSMRRPDRVGTVGNQDENTSLYIRHQMPRRSPRGKRKMHPRAHTELVALEHFLHTVQVDDSVVGVAGDDGAVLEAGHAEESVCFCWFVAEWGEGKERLVRVCVCN